MPAKKPPTRNLTNAVPVKLTPAIEQKVKDAAESTGLKKSDVLRMSLERGVEVLLQQLTSKPAA